MHAESVSQDRTVNLTLWKRETRGLNAAAVLFFLGALAVAVTAAALYYPLAPWIIWPGAFLTIMLLLCAIVLWGIRDAKRPRYKQEEAEPKPAKVTAKVTTRLEPEEKPKYRPLRYERPEGDARDRVQFR